LQDERFTSLEKTLQQTIETLLQHLVEIHQKLEAVTALNDASQIPGLSKGYVLASSQGRGNKAQDEQRLNLALLHALHFPTMTHRQEEIAEAHRRTFSWIFHDQQGASRINPSRGRRPWSNFVKWLREDMGVYWINGKAGSNQL
jgi:hypothetical protein